MLAVFVWARALSVKVGHLDGTRIARYVPAALLVLDHLLGRVQVWGIVKALLLPQTRRV